MQTSTIDMLALDNKINNQQEAKDIENKKTKSVTPPELNIFNAIKNKKFVAALELINEPNIINSRDAHGFTPLHWAAIVGSKTLVEKLLQKGADISAENYYGETAFHWAAWMGKRKLVKFFIDQNVDISKASYRGKTALQGACQFFHKDIIELLLDKQAPFKKEWITDVHWEKAARVNNLRKLKYLISLVGIPPKKMLDRLLSSAVFQENKIVAEFLLQNGAEPNLADCNSVKMAELLLSYGADINKTNDYKQTLLNKAVRLTNMDLIKFALKHHADISLSDYSGFTPLTLTKKYYDYIHVPAEKTQEVQNLLASYIIQQKLENEFVLLLNNNFSFKNFPIETIDKDSYAWLLSLFRISDIAKHGLRDIIHALDQKYEATHELEWIKNVFIEKNYLPLKINLLLHSCSSMQEKLSKAPSFIDDDYLNQIIRVLKLENAKGNGIKDLGVQLSSPIACHANYLFRHIYNFPYPNANHEAIARFYHGISHTGRAALYIPVLANLYKKYADKDAQNLTPDDIKLTQIAALIHDAGREAEGVDYWDKDSGILTYVYLKKMGVAEEKAKLLAEAVANKDPEEGSYLKLHVKEDSFEWERVPQKSGEKNIYQKLIHDADCLDIIRVRERYKFKYLDFYKYIAYANINAFYEMQVLIKEVTALIEQQGDGKVKNSSLKQKYERENGFENTLTDIENKNSFPLLNQFYTPNKLLSSEELAKISFLGRNVFDPSKACEEENIKAALAEGKLFARAIKNPAHINKIYPDGSVKTNAAFEVDKTARRKGIPTRTKKANRLEKQGNPNRSISMIGFGTDVFGKVGFLILNPNPANITSVSKQNAGTGFAKKTDFVPSITSSALAIAKLNELSVYLQRKFIKRSKDSLRAHDEITCNLEDYQGVYYSDELDEKRGFTLDGQIAFLEAVYLQKEYERVYHKKLPIFRYSPGKNSIQIIFNDVNRDEYLVNFWTVFCAQYINTKISSLSEEGLIEFIAQDQEKIKLAACNKSYFTEGNVTLDSNYTDEQKQKINTAIQLELKNALIRRYYDIKKDNAEEATKFLVKIFSKSNFDTNLIEINDANELENILQGVPAEKRVSLLESIGLKKLKSFMPDVEARKSLLLKYLTYEKYLCFTAAEKLAEMNLFLLEAIKEGDDDKINHWLAQGADIKFTDRFGFKAIHWAAICGNERLVKRLAEKGADLEANSPFGETPLHLAAWYGHKNIVNYLLKQGCDPNRVTRRNKTALTGAIEFAYPDIVELLNQATQQQQTIPPKKILLRYTRENNLAEIEKLLKHSHSFDNATKQQALRQIDFTHPAGFQIFQCFLQYFGKIDFHSIDLPWLFSVVKANEHCLPLFIAIGLKLDKAQGFELLRTAIMQSEFTLAAKLLEYGALPIWVTKFWDYSAFESITSRYNIGKYSISKSSNEPAEQAFLQKVFKLFGQCIIDHQMLSDLTFFFKYLNEIPAHFIYLHKLTEKNLLTMVDHINSLVNGPVHYEWLTETKVAQLNLFKEQLIGALTLKQKRPNESAFFSPKNKKMKIDLLSDMQENGMENKVRGMALNKI